MFNKLFFYLILANQIFLDDSNENIFSKQPRPPSLSVLTPNQLPLTLELSIQIQTKIWLGNGHDITFLYLLI